MNSVKLALAALLLGTFALSVTGCPGKKEEAAPAAVESTEDTAPEAVETEEVIEETAE